MATNSHISTISIRKIACQNLYQIITNGRSLTDLLDLLSNKYSQSSKENIKFLKALLFNTLRYYFQTQAILNAPNKLLKKPLRSKDQDIQDILFLGLTEIISLSTPDFALVNEYVNCVPKHKTWAKKLINAVLRKAVEDRATILDLYQKFSKQSLPIWMIQKLKKSWPEYWKSIIKETVQRAPMTLRVNLSKTTLDQYSKLLDLNNIKYLKSHLSSAAIILDSPCDVKTLPQFNKGWISVQDCAAQAVLNCLDINKNNLKLLDACSAPGGKTCHILEQAILQKLAIDLTACDISEERLKKLSQNIQRLDLLNHSHIQFKSCIKNMASTDQSNYLDYSNTFDRILLDVPCSGSGVIRRHPDIAILRRETDIPALAKTQLQILKNAWSMLKNNGKLIYTTCSIFPEENELNIKCFLDYLSHSKYSFKIHKIDFKFDFYGVNQNIGCQFFPSQANLHDGFYFAVLEKLGE